MDTWEGYNNDNPSKLILWFDLKIDTFLKAFYRKIILIIVVLSLISLILVDAGTTIFLNEYCKDLGAVEHNPITKEYHEKYGVFWGQIRKDIFYEFPRIWIPILLSFAFFFWVGEKFRDEYPIFSLLISGIIILLFLIILLYYSPVFLTDNIPASITCLLVKFI